MEWGSSVCEFHFRDKEIRGKHGTCCEFSMTVGVRVCRLLERECP